MGFSADKLPTFSINKTKVETKAAIAIDNQTIFQIGGSNQLATQERTNAINVELQLAVESPTSHREEIKQHNQSPVIYLNERYGY